MSDTTDQILADAFDLIEAEQLTEAEALLKPILEEEDDNVDAWWLYAHAVSDPETARMALNQVLKLDETYVEARDMLEELEVHFSSEAQTPVPPPVLPESEIDTASATFDELEDDDPLFSLANDDEPVFGDREATDDAAEKTERSSLPVFLVLLLIIVLLVAVVLIVNPFGSSETPTATSVAQQSAEDTATPSSSGENATEIPTVSEQQATTDADTTTPDSQPATDEPMTPTVVEIEPATGALTDVVSEALESFELAPDSIGIVQTSLDDTLVAGVCSTSDRAQLQETLDGSLVALASVSETVIDDVDAIGVALVDCENDNQIIRVIGVSVNAAAGFANGEVGETEFRALWQAIA